MSHDTKTQTYSVQQFFLIETCLFYEQPNTFGLITTSRHTRFLFPSAKVNMKMNSLVPTNRPELDRSRGDVKFSSKKRLRLDAILDSCCMGNEPKSFFGVV